MPVIDAQSVSKRFLLKHNASVELKVRFLGMLHKESRQSIEEFWAIKDVSLSIDHGESVGLVGRNGSGKSTFLKLIAAIHRPTSGRMLVARQSRISSMIELGVGFHPELTGRENVFLNAAIHGLEKSEIERIYDAVVEYSGLGHFIDIPIKGYSSGMHMRLGFAISANLDPDILLLDEIFAVGDADFQQRCTGTIRRFMDEGKTIIFVSHAAPAVQAICRRVCVLEEGELGFDGGVDEGLAYYDALLARRAGHTDIAEAVPPPDTAESSPVEAHTEEPAGAEVADIHMAPHRLAAGGHWESNGLWQFDLLRKDGLRPSHYVLDVACGSLSAAVHLLPFLDAHHYWGIDRDPDLVAAGLHIELPRAGVSAETAHFVFNDAFALDEVPETFDWAIATSLFPYVPFNTVAQAIARVVRVLKPTGRFYATWFENPDPANYDPIVRPGGGFTYPDRQPFHYPFELIERVCRSVGARVERVGSETNERGESVLLITRAPSHSGRQPI